MPLVRVSKARLGLPMLVLSLLGLVGLVSCTREPGVEDDFLQLGFEVDGNLLAPPDTIEGAFILRAPRGWEPLESEAFEAAGRAVAADRGSVPALELVRAFGSEDGAACVVSRSVDEISLATVLGMEFEQSLRRRFGSEDITLGMFRVNDLSIVQYRIVQPDVVAFRLFFVENANLYQLDYIIPTAVYQASIRRIESSMGSMASVKQRKEVNG